MIKMYNRDESRFMPLKKTRFFFEKKNKHFYGQQKIVEFTGL